ncbi:hypothetical protein [Parasegetibacter sp. NRK P23]|uniref:hypothetical protein n=1 Tax=Parasegetibacter sp. NRK P23 TaxID=2942999 RepID=UPI0020437A8B|nr:hypothetical protein [Parasegetibacter sp. NRK P23]MCM5528967.1 hypothetical protein [Parasegetibacter sp. NRK P23]
MEQENITNEDVKIAEQMKIYPTTPNENGDFFESLEDEEMGIQTHSYENGSKVKKCKLPASGFDVVVRQLRGKDSKMITRFTNGDAEKYQMAAMTIATTVNGKNETMEFYEELYMKDFATIMAMVGDLNF